MIHLFPRLNSGAMYSHSVKNNLYFGMGKAYQNPNDPHSQRHKNYSLIGEVELFFHALHCFEPIYPVSLIFLPLSPYFIVFSSLSTSLASSI